MMHTEEHIERLRAELDAAVNRMSALVAGTRVGNTAARDAVAATIHSLVSESEISDINEGLDALEAVHRDNACLLVEIRTMEALLRERSIDPATVDLTSRPPRPPSPSSLVLHASPERDEGGDVRSASADAAVMNVAPHSSSRGRDSAAAAIADVLARPPADIAHVRRRQLELYLAKASNANRATASPAASTAPQAEKATQTISFLNPDLVSAQAFPTSYAVKITPNVKHAVHANSASVCLIRQLVAPGYKVDRIIEQKLRDRHATAVRKKNLEMIDTVVEALRIFTVGEAIDDDDHPTVKVKRDASIVLREEFDAAPECIINAYPAVVKTPREAKLDLCACTISTKNLICYFSDAATDVVAKVAKIKAGRESDTAMDAVEGGFTKLVSIPLRKVISVTNGGRGKSVASIDRATCGTELVHCEQFHEVKISFVDPTLKMLTISIYFDYAGDAAECMFLLGLRNSGLVAAVYPGVNVPRVLSQRSNHPNDRYFAPRYLEPAPDLPVELPIDVDIKNRVENAFPSVVNVTLKETEMLTAVGHMSPVEWSVLKASLTQDPSRRYFTAFDVASRFTVPLERFDFLGAARVVAHLCHTGEVHPVMFVEVLPQEGDA